VGPSAGLDIMEVRKLPCFCRELNSGHPAVAIPTELSRLLYPHTYTNRKDATYEKKEFKILFFNVSGYRIHL
jgi:hypothetical protein